MTTASDRSLRPLGLHARLRAQVGALRIEVDLDTGPGTLVLVGPNGAGKTTVLSLLLGALPVRGGRIEVGGHVLFDEAHGIDLPTELRGLGYVPQETALFPHLDVRGNVAFAAEHGHGGASPRERRERVDILLGELGLAGLASRGPASLSGGEKQRVALARALAIEPRALLLDEPLAALDVHARAEVRSFLIDTLARRKVPALIVTHEARDVRAFGGRVAVLEAGEVTQAGIFRELVEAPASPFVAALIAGETPSRGAGSL